MMRPKRQVFVVAIAILFCIAVTVFVVISRAPALDEVSPLMVRASIPIKHTQTAIFGLSVKNKSSTPIELVRAECVADPGVSLKTAFIDDRVGILRGPMEEVYPWKGNTPPPDLSGYIIEPGEVAGIALEFDVDVSDANKDLKITSIVIKYRHRGWIKKWEPKKFQYFMIEVKKSEWWKTGK